MAHFAQQAAAKLTAEGIEAEVVDVRSLSPLDWPTLLASARKSGRALIVEEGPKTGGVGAEIAAGLAERAPEVRIARLASADIPVPFSPALEKSLSPRPRADRHGRPPPHRGWWRNLNDWEVAMLRSEVDAAIERAKSRLKDNCFHLPAFAFWTPEHRKSEGAECDETGDCKLGWDITDFGAGDFVPLGLVAFTLRNGHSTLPRYRSTPYCEKVMIVGEAQPTPMHRHTVKQEDIIFRAGGDLAIEVYRVGADGRLGREDVALVLDCVSQRVLAGHRFVLEPGQSIQLTPDVFHEFYAGPQRDGGRRRGLDGERRHRRQSLPRRPGTVLGDRRGRKTDASLVQRILRRG